MSRARLGLLDEERFVVGAQDGPSSPGIQAWEPLPSRARQKLPDRTLRQVVRRDVMTDGKEHVWGDTGLAGVVLPDDVGDDRGKVTMTRPRATQGEWATIQDCQVLVGPLVEIEAPAAVDQVSRAELRCGRGCERSRDTDQCQKPRCQVQRPSP